MLLGRDLKSARLICLKASLFVLIIALAGILNLIQDELLLRLLSLLLVAWASARFYYFLFHVIEHYIDDRYRFSGLGSVFAWWLERRRRPGD